MKKLMITLTLLLVLLGAAPVLASDRTQVDVYEQGQLVKSVVFVIGRDEYFINNQTPGIKMDAVPFIENSRTFVPVRYLSNALGVGNDYIKWESPKVTLEQPGMPVVELWVGRKEIRSNGRMRAIDVAPVLKSDPSWRTYLPARFVAEALGYQVEWDGEHKIVLCWPKGEEKPDIGKVTKYVEAIQSDDYYVHKGFVIPKETVVSVDTTENFDLPGIPSHAEIDLTMSVFEPLEQQWQEIYDILASKFGPDFAKEVVDHIKVKTNRDDKVEPKMWTVNGQDVFASSRAGSFSISITVWEPGY